VTGAYRPSANDWMSPSNLASDVYWPVLRVHQEAQALIRTGYPRRLPQRWVVEEEGVAAWDAQSGSVACAETQATAKHSRLTREPFSPCGA
jgi:hypothetical protein